MLAKVGPKLLGLGDSKGISVDAQIGDRENDVETQIGGSKATGDVQAGGNAKVTISNETADSKIGSAENVTVQNVPPWVLVLLVIGWLVPTPTALFEYAKATYKSYRTKRGSNKNGSTIHAK